MLDTTPLTAAVDRLADRLRAMPHSALLRGAGARGHALADELARRAQLLEFPERGTPYALPDAGPFVVGDQLAVAGHDLADALAARGTEAALADAVRLVAEAGDAVARRR